jgi:asparagine synthase (glutamine-hydrolysing)
MCGLAGIAAIGADLGPGARHDLLRMSAAVAHRGPDGENLLLDDRVGFAFRRLALVGPADGDQPLHDERETVALIVNGEVYNHRELSQGMRLRTRSDCEVLAHLYAARGRDFLDDVRGMFAIALHDRRRRRLILARDRFGIKPLYFTRVGNLILFGSEIKALLQVPGCPRELDWMASLSDQALHGAPLISTDRVNCWFRGITSVPAGTIVSIDLNDGTQENHAYWQLPDFSRCADGPSDEEFISAYRNLLSGAVADCAAADAEVGLFLSGGVDSAAVAALAAGHGMQVHTFTVCSASTVASGDANAARLVAGKLGLPNHQLLFPPDLVPQAADWKRLLWLLETPLCSPAQFYTYELHRYARQARPQLKGMMLGQASDEFNGGYSAVLSPTGDWAGFEATLEYMAESAALEMIPPLLNWRAHTGLLPVSDSFLRAERRGPPEDLYQDFIRWKYRDIQQYNCWHEDRTAAGNGIEARVPFLDHRIVELMATVPPARRPDLLWDKAVLRRAVADLLPESIVCRRKVSFYHDEGAEHTHRVFLRMLERDGEALIEEALGSKGAQDYLNAHVIREWFAALRASRSPKGTEFLLRLINLGLLDHMVRNPPPSLPAHSAADLAVARQALAEDTGHDDLLMRLSNVRVPDVSDIVRLGDNVDAVRPVNDESVIYLAVDGYFEYVVDAREDAAWFRFVLNIGRGRPLGDVLALAGTSVGQIAESLAHCLSADIIAAEPAPVLAASGPAQGQP